MRRFTWLFPLVLWAFATLFLGGALGEWTDDYAYDRRDYVTGESTLPFGGYLKPYFFRPLYYLLVPELQTALGGHDWVLHALSASIHGVNGVLLWSLLKAAGCARRFAAAGALAFLAYPAPWEVIFWPSAIPTGLATALVLCTCILFLAFVRARVGWWSLLLFGAMAFAITCLNEQPATGLAALPLLAQAAEPYKSRRRRWVWAWFTTLAAVAIYIALLVSTAPKGVRGSVGTFVSLHELGDKGTTTLGLIKTFMLLPHFRGGAARIGASELAGSMPRSILWMALLAAALVPWARWWLSTDAAPRSRSPSLHLIAFGAAVFILGWVPVLLIRGQGVEPRLCYSPAIGLFIAIAGACDAWIEPLLRRRRICRFAAGAALLSLVTVGAITLIGVQSAMQRRWRRDLAQAQQLRDLFPQPASGTLFIPVRIDERNTETGASFFDNYFCGATERPWSGGPWIKRGYRRRDVDAGFWSRFADWRPSLTPGPKGLSYDDRFLPPIDELKGEFERDGRGGKILPWALTIPILIDGHGRIRPVTRFVSVDPDGTSRTYQVPQVAAILDRGGVIGLRAETAQPSQFTVDWNP